MKRIHLFIASSYELKSVRDFLTLEVERKNHAINKVGIDLVVERWEYESEAIPQTGTSQDHYDKAIEKSDIVALLVKNKVGAYTKHEFEYARDCLLKNGNPKVIVYFLPPDVDYEESSLIMFKENLSEIGYFPSYVENQDVLWNKFGGELELIIQSHIKPINTYENKSIPYQLEDCLRHTGYHALTLSKEDTNRKLIEADITAEDFISTRLLEALGHVSVIIAGERGSGKSTLLARFFASHMKSTSLFYVPVNELDYGLDESRQESISSYLYTNYFSNVVDCGNPSDVFSIINGLSDAVFILDGYNELEFYHTDAGGWIERTRQFDNDIMKLRDACQSRLIITSRDDVVTIGSHFVLFRLQRISEAVVQSFLAEAERELLLSRKGYISQGDKNELVDNLRTPILLNAFDELIRSNDEIIGGVSLGMFERPTNKGQIFYNYLCSEMFKYRDNHKQDAIEYAQRGLIFLKYVVPFLARTFVDTNRTQIDQHEINKTVKKFLEQFNSKFVACRLFDDLNSLVVGNQSKNLLDIVALDISDDGSTALSLLINNYHIIKSVRKKNPFAPQRYAFQHPLVAEVLSILDIWNQMLIQNENENFDIVNDILALPMSRERKELLADFCAIKE